VARIELYSSSREFALHGSSGRHFWRKLFGPITPSNYELHELSAVVNKMTGVVNLAALGVSLPQQQFENKFFIFRYARCVLGLVSDALQGGCRGNESRIQVAGVAVFATAALMIL
jgi:hypothetical protein